MKTDIPGHTVSVTWEDTVTSLDIITQALNDAGYTVGEAEKIEVAN